MSRVLSIPNYHQLFPLYLENFLPYGIGWHSMNGKEDHTLIFSKRQRDISTIQMLLGLKVEKWGVRWEEECLKLREYTSNTK